MQNKYIYLAGVMDSDGCFNLDGYYPRLLVVNTNYKLVEWLKNSFGGDISFSVVKNKPHWKPRYTWRLQHQKALNLNEKINPYIKVKDNQSLIFLFWSVIRKMFKQYERKESYEFLKNELHKENKRGAIAYSMAKNKK